MAGFQLGVPEEAHNRTYPLLERLRFVSISSSNLDEFQMVRVAGLKGQMEAGVTERSDDGRTPAQQLAAISETVKRLQGDQQESFRELRGELAAADFHLVDDDALTADERQWLEDISSSRFFPRSRRWPSIRPIATSFPIGACAALQLSQPDGDED